MPAFDFKGKSIIHSHHFSVPFCELKLDKANSCTSKGQKPDLDDNLIIQGDNLQALKSLMPRYANKIKCIYIDPPYNTGNEGWVYNDNVNHPELKKWLHKEVGTDDLQRHDKWLCMMWPRLQLLRELLSDGGVIFISIDDNEAHHLRCVMDEIFGPENFLGQIARASKMAGLAGAHFAPSKDYVLTYAKVKENTPYFMDGINKDLYKKTDEKGLYRDDVALYQSALDSMRGCKNQRYYIKCPDGSLVIPPGDAFPTKTNEAAFVAPVTQNDKVWRWTHSTYMKQKHLLVFKKTLTSPLVDETGNKAKYNVYTKSYYEDRLEQGTTPRDFSDNFLNRQGTDQLKKIGVDFQYPKPAELIKWLLQISGATSGDIVLDSFAGSGTTGQAVLELNKQDGGNRKFILVQCDEWDKDKKKINTIASSVTAERVKRVIKGVPKAKNELLRKGLGGSFSYCALGQPISQANLLRGKNLPTYDSLAKHVFYTATGQSLHSFKENKDFFVSRTRNDTAVFVVYKPDVDFLRSDDSAIDIDRFERLQHLMKQKKCPKALVFAWACYYPVEELLDKGIRFCQLPFSICGTEVGP